MPPKTTAAAAEAPQPTDMLSDLDRAILRTVDNTATVDDFVRLENAGIRGELLDSEQRRLARVVKFLDKAVSPHRLKLMQQQLAQTRTKCAGKRKALEAELAESQARISRELAAADGEERIATDAVNAAETAVTQLRSAAPDSIRQGHRAKFRSIKAHFHQQRGTLEGDVRAAEGIIAIQPTLDGLMRARDLCQSQGHPLYAPELVGQLTGHWELPIKQHLAAVQKKLAAELPGMKSRLQDFQQQQAAAITEADTLLDFYRPRD